MDVFVIYVFITLILGYLLNFYKKTKLLYCIICSTILFLISALRGSSVGTDTQGYIIDFFNWYQYDYVDFFIGENRDIGLKIIAKFILSITNDYQYVLAIVALFFTISITWLIYKYSELPVVSYIALLSLGYFYFSMTGLKQIIAMSFCMFSYKFIKQKKLIPFLLLIICAYLFHNTAIIFLIAYPLAHLQIGKKQIIITVITFVLAMFFLDQIREFIFNFIAWDRIAAYENYISEVSLSGYYIQICTLLFCLLYYRRLKDNEAYNILYNIIYIGIWFQAFTMVEANFFRISMYFNTFSIILLSNVLNSTKNIQLKIIVMTGVLLVLLIYFWGFGYDKAGIYPYKFFWD